MIKIAITGDKEVDALLRQLKECYTKKVLQKAYRRAAIPLKKAIKSVVPVGDYDHFVYGKSGVVGKHMEGDLKKSIGNITGKSKKYTKIYVGPRAKGKYKYAGYIGHWVELGNEYSGIKFKGRKYMRDGYQKGKLASQQRLKSDLIFVMKKILNVGPK